MNEVRQEREFVRFLVFSASLRTGSLNTRLAQLAADSLEAQGGEVDHASMREFDAPSFDADVEQSQGLPPAAEELRRRLVASDAFVIAAPEYNASMPGLLKNAVDWVSRSRPQPFHERHGPLLSAFALDGGRQPGALGACPSNTSGPGCFPGMFSLAQAHKAFDDEGRIADAQLQARFEGTISAFMDLVEAAKHYPCVRSKWVEFLGEHPEPAVDRIE